MTSLTWPVHNYVPYHTLMLTLSLPQIESQLNTFAGFWRCVHGPSGIKKSVQQGECQMMLLGGMMLPWLSGSLYDGHRARSHKNYRDFESVVHGCSAELNTQWSDTQAYHFRQIEEQTSRYIPNHLWEFYCVWSGDNQMGVAVVVGRDKHGVQCHTEPDKAYVGSVMEVSWMLVKGDISYYTLCT